MKQFVTILAFVLLFSYVATSQIALVPTGKIKGSQCWSSKTQIAVLIDKQTKQEITEVGLTVAVEILDDGTARVSGGFCTEPMGEIKNFYTEFDFVNSGLSLIWSKDGKEQKYSMTSLEFNPDTITKSNTFNENYTLIIQ